MGLKFVMDSFTKSQKEIVIAVAKWQLENMGKGLTLQQMWEMSIEQTIFTTKSNMDESLLEILDHKVFIQDESKNYTMAHYPKKVLDNLV